MEETGRKMRERSEENRGEDNEKIMKEREGERERMEECLLLFALTPGTGRWGGVGAAGAVARSVR